MQDNIADFAKGIGMEMIRPSDETRIKWYKFRTQKHEISIYRAKTYDLVHVYDIQNNKQLDNGNLRYEKAVEKKEIDFKDDKYFYSLLLRINKDLPFILNREEELFYFNLCKEGNKINLDEKAASQISVEECRVFKFLSITEDRFWRIGKDDRFDITTITDWSIMFKKELIYNKYLQTLLPRKTEEFNSEYVYDNTFIGSPTESFKLDVIQTEKFYQDFSYEDFFKSFQL